MSQSGVRRTPNCLTKLRSFATFVCGCLAPGCYSHTQQALLDVAARDFDAHVAEVEHGSPRAPVSARPRVRSASSSGKSRTCPESMASERLTPWIEVPNRFYLVEGCGYQARYACNADSCVMVEGTFQKLDPRASVGTVSWPDAASASQTVAAPPSQTAAAARLSTPDEAAVRELLETRRAEILACVERPPIALELALEPAVPATIALRGALKGTPEEGCVRSVLKGEAIPSVTSKGVLLHVLK